MSMQDDLQEGMAALESELSTPQCRYQGQTYPCIVSTLMSGVRLEIGGNSQEISFTILLRKNAVPVSTVDDTEPVSDSGKMADENLPPPAVQKLIEVRYGALGWRTYRILQVGQDGAGAAWECHLGAVSNKGR